MKIKQIQEATYAGQQGVYVVVSYPGTKAWGPFSSRDEAENYIDRELIENGHYTESNKDIDENGLGQLMVIELQV